MIKISPPTQSYTRIPEGQMCIVVYNIFIAFVNNGICRPTNNERLNTNIEAVIVHTFLTIFILNQHNFVGRIFLGAFDDSYLFV